MSIPMCQKMNGGSLSESALDCGCRYDTHTGYALASCKAHDRRTRAVKVAAALQDLGNWLDEAGKVIWNDDNGVTKMKAGNCLTLAGKAAVKAAKAMIGNDEEA